MSKDFDTRAFRDFCAGKPGGRRYNYSLKCACAGFQYLKASGFPVDRVVPGYWVDEDETRHRLPDGVEEAVSARPHNYGALASRLSKLIENES